MHEDKWAVIQLSSQGESLDNVDDLVIAIQKIDSEVEVFVPAFSWTEKGSTEKVVFLPGYLFIRYDLPRERIEKVLECKYLSHILKEGGNFSLVSQEDFEKLKTKFKEEKVREFTEGTTVKIEKGFWKGYSGPVVSVSHEDARVVISVTCTSIERLLDVPIYFVEEV